MTCGPKGECVSPNICKCEDGWLGESCGEDATYRTTYEANAEQDGKMWIIFFAILGFFLLLLLIAGLIVGCIGLIRTPTSKYANL
jgi:hypothetical protein